MNIRTLKHTYSQYERGRWSTQVEGVQSLNTRSLGLL